MDGTEFDDLIRSLSQSRRSLLGSAAATAAGLLAAPLANANARSRRKHKNRKGREAKPNEFGCIEVRDPCRGDDDCCSGVCDGKAGKRRCQAHDSGGCVADAAGATCGPGNVTCTTDLGEAGACATTTGNAGYCRGATYDLPCQTDVDCQEVSDGLLGPRAACVRCAAAVGGGICATVAGTPS